MAEPAAQPADPTDPTDPAGPAGPTGGAGAAQAARAARARLAWHCRRGTRELDLLLQRWLAQRYEDCDAARRAHFAALLEMPDPLLAAYLLAGERPAQPELAELVEAIRTLAAATRTMSPTAPQPAPQPAARSERL